MISLDRSPAYTNHDIPLDADHYYRGINVDSYEDLWEIDADGNQVMKGHGKGGNDALSFQKSHPNNLYVNGIVKSNTIIEGTDAMAIDRHEPRTGYTFVNQIERDRVESGEIPLRIYQRRTLGLGAIDAVHTWDKIYDSFPQDTPSS